MKLLWLPKSLVFPGLTAWKPVLTKQQKLDVNAYQTGPSTPDPAQQVKVIEDLIAKNVNAIIVVPNDAKVLEPVLKKRAIKALWS